MKQSKTGPRFRRYFPVAAFVINNVWKLVPAFVVAALIVSVFSIHYALSVMCIWLGIVCFWVDRKHLDHCLFTPLQPLAVVLIIGLGAGISLVVFDSPEKSAMGYLAMQLVGLLGLPFLIGGYAIVMRKVPGFVFPGLEVSGMERLTKPLIPVGWCCLMLELAKVVVGIVSGASDRGYGGDFLIENPFGWWSAFGVISRLQTFGYILVPLIWRESRLPGKVLVTAAVATTLFLHFVSGSRGAVIYPLFTVLAGAFMFLDFRRMKYEVVLGIGIIALAPLATLMSNYRTSSAFRQTDIRNIFQKLGTLKEGLAQEAEHSDQRFAEAGRAFIGTADAMVYEMTPDVVPHEGFDRLQDAVWTYIPYLLYKGENRPVIQDGYQIVRTYTGAPEGGRTSIEVSFPAELYRRWGWVGVPLGLLLYGLFYGAIFRYVYQFYLFKNALWGFMMCGFFFNFFVSWYWASLLTMIWLWTYDFPKHLLALAALYFAVKAFTNAKSTPGALAMMEASRRHRYQQWIAATSKSASGDEDDMIEHLPETAR